MLKILHARLQQYLHQLKRLCLKHIKVNRLRGSNYELCSVVYIVIFFFGFSILKLSKNLCYVSANFMCNMPMCTINMILKIYFVIKSPEKLLKKNTNQCKRNNR